MKHNKKLLAISIAIALGSSMGAFANEDSDVMGSAENAITGSGSAKPIYTANLSEMSGAITGVGAISSGSPSSSPGTPVNNINSSFTGFVGISQNVQNSGSSALAQQQVSFQGNVNISTASTVVGL